MTSGALSRTGVVVLAVALACVLAGSGSGLRAQSGGTPAKPAKPADAPAAGGGGSAGGAATAPKGDAAKGPPAKQAGGGRARPADIPAPQPGEPLCGWCSTTGRTEFEVDQNFKVEDDHGDTWSVKFCSEAIESPNHAMDWEPCSRCKTPSLHDLAVKLYGEQTAAKQAWLTDRRKVDRAVGAETPLNFVETTHFQIVWDVPKVTLPSKQTFRAHEAAHLYARRMEELYARFQSMFGVVDADNMRNLHYLYVFENQAQAWEGGPMYTGLQGLPTVKRAGGADHQSVIVTWWDRANFPKDQDMYRHQIHNVVHALTAVYYNPRWFPSGVIGLSPPWLNDKYGWLDEGLAHWFEIDFDGRAATYCFREQDVSARWGGENWKKNIFKAVTGGDIPSFSEVATKPSQSLSAKEHQFVWSWVDFLMARDASVMGKAMKLCKQKTETREIMKQCWNLTTLDFERLWTEWVLVNYAPTKGK